MYQWLCRSYGSLKGDIASLKRFSYIPLVVKTAFFIGSQN
ncbi:hypothetical protein FA600_07050 [Campylobacter jejuni]|nr:hypothetical protein [Campylobacter jejuni]EAH4498394.1 hypothetical protein [Campylobacter jejuni]EAH4767659.1 hypothetical protein [Campylobacter jejuni]EAH5155037.1 hypothetical protein [Campylobacter jejuni]EAH5316197.1 hypothetical protein [Campylobacter jejuni]